MGMQRQGLRLVCSWPVGTMTMTIRSVGVEAVRAEVDRQVQCWTKHVPPTVMADATWSMIPAES